MPKEENDMFGRQVTTKEEFAAAVKRTTRTVDRWREDDRLEFPKPIIVRGKLYWYQDELVSWFNKQRESSLQAA